MCWQAQLLLGSHSEVLAPAPASSDFSSPFQKCLWWDILYRASRLYPSAQFRFALKATELLYASEMSRWARRRRWQVSERDARAALAGDGGGS